MDDEVLGIAVLFRIQSAQNHELISAIDCGQNLFQLQSKACFQREARSVDCRKRPLQVY